MWMNIGQPQIVPISSNLYPPLWMHSGTITKSNTACGRTPISTSTTWNISSWVAALPAAKSSATLFLQHVSIIIWWEDGINLFKALEPVIWAVDVIVIWLFLLWCRELSLLVAFMKWSAMRCFLHIQVLHSGAVSETPFFSDRICVGE